MNNSYTDARAKLLGHLTSNGVVDHMFYGPTSDRYWTEPFKLVAVNMEPYGYEGTGRYEVVRDELINWIYDAGKTNTKTTRYTLTILGAVLDCIQNGSEPSRELLSSVYSNDEKIEDTLDRTVYYNIRAQSNSAKPQDYAAIAAVGSSEAGRLVWDEIMALKPDAILVGGQAGLAAVNGLIGSNYVLKFRESVSIGSTLIQSISHPSRPAYDHWCDAVTRITKWKKGA